MQPQRIFLQRSAADYWEMVYADPWAAMHFPEYRFGQVVDMPSCDGIAVDAGPRGEPLE